MRFLLRARPQANASEESRCSEVAVLPLWQHAGRDSGPTQMSWPAFTPTKTHSAEIDIRLWNLCAFSTRNAFASRVLISKPQR